MNSVINLTAIDTLRSDATGHDPEVFAPVSRNTARRDDTEISFHSDANVSHNLGIMFF